MSNTFKTIQGCNDKNVGLILIKLLYTSLRLGNSDSKNNYLMTGFVYLMKENYIMIQ